VNRTVVIRVGSVAQARRELREDLAALVRGARVRHRREIWFASLAQAARTLTERRLELLQLICRRRPRSTADLARAVGRPVKSVEADIRVLVQLGLVKLVGTRIGERPVAQYDRIHLAGDIAVARAAA
jgi:predicted transcriptional regulator